MKPPTAFAKMRANREKPRTPEARLQRLRAHIEREEAMEIALWQPQRELAAEPDLDADSLAAQAQALRDYKRRTPWWRRLVF